MAFERSQGVLHPTPKGCGNLPPPAPPFFVIQDKHLFKVMGVKFLRGLLRFAPPYPPLLGLIGVGIFQFQMACEFGTRFNPFLRCFTETWFYKVL